MYTTPQQRQETRQVQTIIGKSKQAQHMREFAERASQVEHTVLLLGETGVGKDHLAETIHNLSRPGYPFVPVDCGALPETLAETELFGHTKGAFTDAQHIKPGLVQVAEKGTLFFNEVANMSLGMQAKLLQVLDKKSFRPVGSTVGVQVNTRIIAATNVNMKEAVRQGKVRSDLYYRLNRIYYKVPPLRERVEDILELANHFLSKTDGSKTFSPGALSAIMTYAWPGNVRELQDIVVRGAFQSGDKSLIEEEHLFIEEENPVESMGESESAPLPTLKKFLEEMQEKYLRSLLARTGGNAAAAARIAGIAKSNIYEQILRFGLEEFHASVKNAHRKSK